MPNNEVEVWQEFLCRPSGGGCGGYILVRMYMGINRRVKVVCPKCKHEHERKIADGRIINDDGRGGKIDEIFTPLKSAWKEKPTFKGADESGNAKIIASSIVRETWAEYFGEK